MQVFQTDRQIHEYLVKKRKILIHQGIKCYGWTKDFYGRTAFFQDLNTGDRYISVLLFSKHTGRGLVKSIQEYHGAPIITMESCGIKDYLEDKNIPYKLIEEGAHNV